MRPRCTDSQVDSLQYDEPIQSGIIRAITRMGEDSRFDPRSMTAT